MLILTRRPGQTVKIGSAGEIEVVVLGVKGNQVRIGFKAPDGVPVHREEIFDRILAQRPKARDANGNTLETFVARGRNAQAAVDAFCIRQDLEENSDIDPFRSGGNK